MSCSVNIDKLIMTIKQLQFIERKIFLVFTTLHVWALTGLHRASYKNTTIYKRGRYFLYVYVKPVDSPYRPKHVEGCRPDNNDNKLQLCQ